MQVYAHDALPESIAKVPAAEVYPVSGRDEAATFKRAVWGGDIQIRIDLYARVRSNLADDTDITITLIDQIRQVLSNATELDPFAHRMDIDWTLNAPQYGRMTYFGAYFILTISI